MLVFLTLIIFPAYGQDAFQNKVPVGKTGGVTYFGEMHMSNLGVIEKDRYNIIKFIISVNVDGLPFTRTLFVDTNKTILRDSGSTTYRVDHDECSIPIGYRIDGKVTVSGSYAVCYSVGKNITDFTVMYDEIPIGSINLNEYLNSMENNSETTIPHSEDIFSIIVSFFKKLFQIES